MEAKGTMTSQQSLRDDPLLNAMDDVPAPSPLDMSSQYNSRNPAVKRLFREAMEFVENEDRSELHAQPLDDNLFEWHFTFRGSQGTPFENGIYHGRVIFPSTYPLHPPEIVVLTPNGRFETGTKICLSISNYHPESWLPSWSIRTAIQALRGFMINDTPGAIGSLECSAQIRSKLAKQSQNFVCPSCGPTNRILLPERPDKVESTQTESQTAETDGDVKTATTTGDEKEGTSLEKEVTSVEKEGGKGDTTPELEVGVLTAFAKAAAALDDKDIHIMDEEEQRRELEVNIPFAEVVPRQDERILVAPPELMHTFAIVAIAAGICTLLFRRMLMYYFY